MGNFLASSEKWTLEKMATSWACQHFFLGVLAVLRIRYIFEIFCLLLLDGKFTYFFKDKKS
jgi:hypothetical protein